MCDFCAKECVIDDCPLADNCPSGYYRLPDYAKNEYSEFNCVMALIMDCCPVE